MNQYLRQLLWFGIDSPFGPISLGFIDDTLVEVIFDYRDSLIRKKTRSIDRAIQAFKRYFEGRREFFNDISIDISCGSPFEKKVWLALRRIPYGKTISYASIAESIGHPKAARAVGRAIGRNPVPIVIPCHRVIRSNGSLGGFSGGIDIKKKLLELEGAIKNPVSISL